MIISDDNLDIVILCALRYAMTRRSYVVGTMRDFIKKHWPELNEHTKNNITRDIGTYLTEDRDDPKDIYETWKQLYRSFPKDRTAI